MNKKNFINTIGLMLIITALLKYDLDNYSIECNKKACIKICVGILVLVLNYVFYKLKLQKTKP